ncbi:MAG TPA: aminotransferase class V-fold PLP-dependent enzyme [Myxococcota bacterium]|nr:aminotransferase class V-fold PLP-dependent enzyme [Myxococcota bacterium]
MQFGRELRALWGLDPDATYLNHGAFGAAPLEVLAAQRVWRDRMERQPFRYFVDELAELTREAAGRLAAYCGASGEDLVFVPNATTAINSVLRSLEFAPGDRIVVLEHVYVGIGHSVEYVCSRTGAVMDKVPLPCPPESDFLSRLGERLVGARLAILDHITSATGLLLPIEEMVRLCRERGVPVLVDGAHAPGQVPLELAALGATWYTGNAHKWLCAPKGCAFLWASQQGQVGLHPAVISNGYGRGFHAEFDYTGTSDTTAHLSIHACLDFRARLGDAAIREHNTALAKEGRRLLLDALETQGAGAEAHVGSLATIRLPMGEPTMAAAQRLSRRIWEGDRIEVPIFAHAGHLWLRISAQIYNERDEYLKLAQLLSRMR